ncbi:hypothetical protein PAPYR_10340 [Paratrimastix pyriformis]|uniref:rRNA-processing protein FYV7 n=1 Tax=Paratrimastix pyriformis TaxID=342808 RepID=A0ABQ8UAB2_9EUKA|nr:hypothetical protein PAPYR_10340 [Paratrimastix pyriformis]
MQQAHNNASRQRFRAKADREHFIQKQKELRAYRAMLKHEPVPQGSKLYEQVFHSDTPVGEIEKAEAPSALAATAAASTPTPTLARSNRFAGKKHGREQIADDDAGEVKTPGGKKKAKPDLYKRAKSQAAQLKAQQEKARREREEQMQKQAEELKAKRAKRAKESKLMRKKTPRGQPLMRTQIEHLLGKLQAGQSE